MRYLALILLVGVFFFNDTANWISQHSRYSPAAAYYILQGLWIATLSTVLLAFFMAAKKTLWSTLAVFALLVSISESLQRSVCRIPIVDMNKVHGDLCDYITGLPIGSVSTVLYVAILAWIIGAHILDEN